MYQQNRRRDMVERKLGPRDPPTKDCPPNNKYTSIAELFQQFQSQLEGTCVIDLTLPSEHVSLNGPGFEEK
jgi:hypothetical protein